jgi:pantoate--beta-alanine ligase
VFVNPTQFGAGEDFDRYPRSLEADVLELGKIGGVDFVFAPSDEEMYPGGADSGRVLIQITGMTDVLCGPFRPGHFEAVATVVCKLFAACRPDVAVFGRKDAQQFVIIRQVVKDLNLGVEIVGLETIREPDGLALSSRNTYLSESERAQAVVLSRAIEAAKVAIESGEQNMTDVVALMNREVASAALARLQYAAVVDGDTLGLLTRCHSGQSCLVALAAHFGSTRLIDSAFVEAP